MSEYNRIKNIIKRDGTTVPFDEDKIVNAIYKAAYAVGGHDRTLAQKLAQEVTEIVNFTYGSDGLPSVEEIQDVVEKTLIERGHAKTAKAFILYRAERSRARQEETGRIVSENIPYRKIYEILNWSIDHNVETIEKLNKIIDEGRFPELIRDANQAYEADIFAAAQKIIARRNNVKIVIIAGPSSSGKTTTTQKLGEYLKQAGLELISIGLDNYFYDLDVHPRDEFGDYDFETPHAMDLDLINQHLAQLIEGQTVGVPIYNFKTGKREASFKPLSIDSSQLILIDSLHGLHDPVTQGIPAERKFKIYIETLAQMKDKAGRLIRWTDLRLLRRMIRDSQHRNHSPRRTLEHWHYVRRAELRYIFPYVNFVDHIINGALAYELPIMKHKLFKYFEYFLDLYSNDPSRQTVLDRAARVHALLDQVHEWSDDSIVPHDSLLREFIGGGIYEV